MKLKQKPTPSVIILAIFTVSMNLVYLVGFQSDKALAQSTRAEAEAFCDASIPQLSPSQRENCIEGAMEGNLNDGSEVEEECVGEDCCGGVKTSLLQNTGICDDEDGVVFGLLKWILRLMTAGVGIAAVGGIGYGALLYTTAEGKPEQTKKGIEVITNVVIGIAAYALMFVLLNFLIPGGAFG